MGNDDFINLDVSTHSRPKAAGPRRAQHGQQKSFQLTAARRRLALGVGAGKADFEFQLTAARRRLALKRRRPRCC